MSCPQCGCVVTKVKETRKQNDSVERWRECLRCGNRWKTTEIDRDQYQRLSREKEKY